jgi:hypothetical protein
VATFVEIIDAVDAFMATPKRVLGHDSSPQWGREVVMKYPLEVEGELRGAQLMVVGFPRERKLKFRLGILFPAMVCRLDYTDEGRAVPYSVTGPHYHSWPLNRHHSWPLNRRFFRGVTTPQRLHDAVPYDGSGRSFDAILRWFCADTKIESLPPDHLISLPPSDLLL